MSRHKINGLAALVAALIFVACDGAKEPPGSGESASGAAGAAAGVAAGAAAAGGEQTPDAGGQVIKVEMLTDEQGNNVFRPADVTAKRGDVIRYTLVGGVHNVHFLADSNPGVAGLPPAGDLLQLPGQTWDVKVTFPAGKTLFYQCDPHALLGMVGHVTVAQ